jgi:alpha-D-xyloside xylohydrolase
MNQPIDWQSIIAPIDVMNLPVPRAYLRRWLEYDRDETGVTFRCELANGRSVNYRLDVIRPDIVRIRLNPADIRPGPAEMLVPQAWPPAEFELEEQPDCLILTTARLRLEFQRLPWQMRIYDNNQPRSSRNQPTNQPFFSQRIDDRAYGYSFEVPPIGFDEQPGGGLAARETVAVSPGENFYGLGEKFTSLNKWGQEITSWATDSGNVVSQRSYKNVPFLLSSAGYGLFIHSAYPIVYRLGSESSISYSFHIADSQLDYFLIYGPAFKQILKGYTDLTGRASMPPKWSFGFWISRCGYKSQTEVEAVIREMRARDFPCDVLSIDPWWMGEAPWCTYEWNKETFPEPEAMLRRLRHQGVRTCLWIHPYVPTDTRTYEEGVAGGYFVHKSDGSVPAPVMEAFSGDELAAIDFTNPAAVQWFQAKLEALLEMGVAVFKSDFGEQAPVDARYHDGRTGLEMHNLYPLLYNKAVFELTERYFGRGLTWGRAGYAGSQRYPVQWGGDSYSSLDQIAGQLRGLLSYGLSGVPFCSHDVGGFDYSPQAFDHDTQEDYPKDDVTYVRWLQFGVFSSHLRAHGKQPREPWTYGPEIEAIARRYLKLRYRLLPYIYSEAVRSTQTGLPMVKPLVLEFQDDPNTYHLDWEYLFGDSFLVAPVFSPAGRGRVYLPAGEWLDYWTKERLAGGQWFEVDAPLDVLPVWVRAGAIIPLGPESAYVEEKAVDPVTLELYYPQSAGETVIYDEDRPAIKVRYACRGNRLEVEIDPAPGQIEIVLYGVSATTASRIGQSLQLAAWQGGQRISFDGTTAATVTFLLEA